MAGGEGLTLHVILSSTTCGYRWPRSVPQRPTAQQGNWNTSRESIKKRSRARFCEEV
jgi:hypothetical protein